MQITCNKANTLASNIISCGHFILYLALKMHLVPLRDVVMSTEHLVCFSRFVVQSFCYDSNRLKFIQASDRVTEYRSLGITCDDMSLVRDNISYFSESFILTKLVKKNCQNISRRAQKILCENICANLKKELNCFLDQ